MFNHPITDQEYRSDDRTYTSPPYRSCSLYSDDVAFYDLFGELRSSTCSAGVAKKNDVLSVESREPMGPERMNDTGAVYLFDTASSADQCFFVVVYSLMDNRYAGTL